MPRQLVDLSHSVHHGLETYRGLPAPVVSDFLSREASRSHYAPGTTFHIGKIEMVANTGTYIDAPSHRFADGADLSRLPLESVADLPGVLVRVAAGQRVIDVADLSRATGAGDERVDLRGKAVLFATGWSRHWATEAYFAGHPYLTGALAERLVASGAALVGIDSLNIDDTADGARPVHTALLRAGVPVVEHLTGLEALPDDDVGRVAPSWRFFAVPVKVVGMGTFPVRAFAIVE